MHPRMQRLVIAATAVVLTACGQDAPVGPTAIRIPPQADGTTADYAVVLADGSTQIRVGESVTLRASTTVRRSRTVRWSSSNTSVVSVSSYGTATGRAVGSATVTATGSNGSRSQFAMTVVSSTTRTAPVVATVDITAPATTMTVGGTMTLSATARDSAGAAVTGRTVTWAVSGSAVTVGSTGVVTAVAAGSSDVRATVDGVSAARTISVAAPTVTDLTISPKTGSTLAPGQTRQFTTTGTWSDLATRAVSTTYSATGGTISSSGLYTAGQLAGTFMVIASCGCGHADTAALVIASTSTPTAQLTTLTISPKTVSLNTGATQQFSAAANWSTGATTLPPVSYSATGGSVSSSGLYTAPATAGTYRVIVAHTGGTRKDTAVVTVQFTQTASPTDFTPNLPSGMTLITDARLGSLRTDGVKNETGLAFYGDGRNGTDNSAPYGSGVFESVYPGNDAGNGVGGAILGGNEGQPWRKIYFSLMMWVPENYSIHTNREKFFYPLISTPGQPLQGTNIEWALSDSETANGPTFGFTFNSQVPGPGTFFSQPGASPARVRKGRWTRIEMYCALNNPGKQDGVWQVWVDGQVAADVRNVKYSQYDVPSTFLAIRFAGTRGGGASQVLTPAEGQVRRYNRVAFYASNDY